jgi:hypothetical protein
MASSSSAAGDGGLVAPRGEEGGLVDDVGEVGPGEARRTRGDLVHVHVGAHLHLARMDPEDGRPARAVGAIDKHLTVEAAGAQEGRVEHLGAVGGREEDDALVGLEAVHLHEELVERLLALLVGAEHVGAAGAPEGVELVDEDDARRRGLGGLKQVAHAGRADADKHLHKLAARQGEEGHPGLARDGPGQQRLARTRGAYQQHPFGDARPDGDKLLRRLEKLHHLLELLLGLLDAGDVVEAHGDLALADGPRPSSARRPARCPSAPGCAARGPGQTPAAPARRSPGGGTAWASAPRAAPRSAPAVGQAG